MVALVVSLGLGSLGACWFDLSKPPSRNGDIFPDPVATITVATVGFVGYLVYLLASVWWMNKKQQEGR